MRSRIMLAVIVALPVVTYAASAHADEHCGSVRATWNVPRGGAVFGVGRPGPITAVINGIGESRTHSMLSLGSTRVIHATSHTPAARAQSESGFCSAPLNAEDLRHLGPGATNISVSAAYENVGSALSVTYQNGTIVGPGSLNLDQGNAIATTATSFATDPPMGIDFVPPRFPPFGGGGGTPAVTKETPYALLLDGSHHAPYVLSQYMSPLGRNNGIAPSTDGGVVCSTLLAFFQGRSAAGGGFGSPDVVQTHPYTHERTAAAGYALYDAVKTACTSAEEPAWYNEVAAYAYCGGRDPCAHAAAQVRNCMAFGDCGNGEPDRFDAAVKDPSFAANSISPDWLAGYVAGQDWGGPNQSVWAKDYGRPVTFSVGGAAYACWE